MSEEDIKSVWQIKKEVDDALRKFADKDDFYCIYHDQIFESREAYDAHLADMHTKDKNPFK